MLDDHDGVSHVYQAVKDVEQPVDVGEVQTGSGLVEDVHRAAGGPLAEFGGELDALRLAAREGGARLAEGHVSEADVGEGLKHALDCRKFEKVSNASSTLSRAPPRC